MKRIVLFGLLFVSILGIRPTAPPPAQAQQNKPPKSGCDARVIDRLAATTDVLDYRAACESFVSCVQADNSAPICQTAAFVEMSKQCPADNGRCHDGALLFAAAMLAYKPLFSGLETPPSVIDSVPLAIEAYWQGDEAGALAAYQLTPTEAYWDNVALPLSRAVLYQRLNQAEMALAEYEHAFKVVFDDPLLYYTRSQLYAELGRMDEAAVDILALATTPFDDPAVQAWVAALQAQFPLAEPGMGEWLYYPVNRYGYGYGTTANDLSLEAPRSVQIGLVDEVGVIVAIGLKSWTSDGYDIPDTIAQILHLSADGNSYELAYPEIGESYGTMRLTPMDGGFVGRESLGLFEGGAAWEFMLVPADAPDPRVILDTTTRYCDGGVRSQLGVGAVVTSISYSGQLPLLLTDTPAGEVVTQVEKSDESYITVVGGPACVGSVTWWEGIHSNGARGWFTENEGTLYVAAHRTIQPDTPFCAGHPPSLATRLSVGMTATVLPDLGANNVHREPSVEAESLGAIPPDATFEIIGGPVCVEDTVWWYADYDGLIGWTVEGQAPTYWLAPAE